MYDLFKICEVYCRKNTRENLNLKRTFVPKTCHIKMLLQKLIHILYRDVSRGPRDDS